MLVEVNSVPAQRTRSLPLQQRGAYLQLNSKKKREGWHTSEQLKATVSDIVALAEFRKATIGGGSLGKGYTNVL